MNPARRILIYRLGSLGDTIVALPALRLVANAFPDAQRRALTNFSVNAKAAPMAAVLEGTGLVHGYMEYPIGLRDAAGLLRLRRDILRFRPDTLVYLAAARGRAKAWRDMLFFRTCGIKHIFGVPYSADQQGPLRLNNGLYEYEGARLARCVRALGDARLDAPNSFDLTLSNTEHQAAGRALSPLPDDRPILVASIGAKVDVKDWGNINWAALLTRLGAQLPRWNLVMLGAADEWDRSEALLANWPGAGVNLCGRISVRESAAVLARARLYLGHDSGPMHLAAAVGTPCVAIFSSRNLPGEWFPYGKQHRVLYHPITCQGCRLEVCLERDKACIRSITVDEVEQAVLSASEQKIASGLD